jgi:hypothetical protein
MTPLEFMVKQLKSEQEDLEKAIARDARKNVLRHIKKRIGYYEAAVAALEKESRNERT